jgi:hypothetical protein
MHQNDKKLIFSKKNLNVFLHGLVCVSKQALKYIWYYDALFFLLKCIK